MGKCCGIFAIAMSNWLWYSLENYCTPLLKVHMRRRPQNVLRASVWFPTNQYLESSLWLTNQIAAATSIYSPVRCAWTHFPGRLPASRFIRWFGVSLIWLCTAHSCTSGSTTLSDTHPLLSLLSLWTTSLLFHNKTLDIWLSCLLSFTGYIE